MKETKVTKPDDTAGLRITVETADEMLAAVEVTPDQRSLAMRRVCKTLELYIRQNPVSKYTGLSRQVVASIVASVVES